ncbi:hypothetical protein DESC_610190 [Desulfosarcina cetonica]|nr:hypothetical protein DESC_610190 [Desulfosarcina cetonica]
MDHHAGCVTAVLDILLPGDGDGSPGAPARDDHGQSLLPPPVYPFPLCPVSP